MWEVIPKIRGVRQGRRKSEFECVLLRLQWELSPAGTSEKHMDHVPEPSFWRRKAWNIPCICSQLAKGGPRGCYLPDIPGQNLQSRSQDMSGKTYSVCLRRGPICMGGTAPQLQQKSRWAQGCNMGCQTWLSHRCAPPGGGASNTEIGQLILMGVACKFMEELSLQLDVSVYNAKILIGK